MRTFLRQCLAIILLAQMAFGAHTITLNWDAPTPAPNPAISIYKIYRGACGHETFLAQVNVPTTTYTDSAVTNGSTYCYFATDVNVNGESVASNEISLTVSGVVGAPTGLSFARMLVGSGPSAAQDVVITNLSGSTVTIQNDSQGGAGINVTGDFAQTNALGTLPQTLANNATFTIHVTFSPTAAGARNGQLTVNSSDGSFVIIPLTGLGATPTPNAPTNLQVDDVINPFPQRTQQINAAWANGVSPGYKPENCGGLTLCVGSGLMADGTGGTAITMRPYVGATLTMSNNTTNYIYLNSAASFVPAKNTTGFVCPNFPIATVTTSGGAITAIVDDRTLFLYCP